MTGRPADQLTRALASVVVNDPQNPRRRCRAGRSPMAEGNSARSNNALRQRCRRARMTCATWATVTPSAVARCIPIRQHSHVRSTWSNIRSLARIVEWLLVTCPLTLGRGLRQASHRSGSHRRRSQPRCTRTWPRVGTDRTGLARSPAWPHLDRPRRGSGRSSRWEGHSSTEGDPSAGR